MTNQEKQKLGKIEKILLAISMTSGLSTIVYVSTNNQVNSNYLTAGMIMTLLPGVIFSYRMICGSGKS